MATTLPHRLSRVAEDNTIGDAGWEYSMLIRFFEAPPS
jgi:hypothetical protein